MKLFTRTLLMISSVMMIFASASAFAQESEGVIMDFIDGEGPCQTEPYTEPDPPLNKKAHISVEGAGQTEFFHYLIGDEIYVSEDLLCVLGITCLKSFDAEKPFLTLTADNEHLAVFYVDDIYATFGGIGENIPYPAFVTDTMPFVPLSRVAEYFECGYNVISDDIYQKNVSISISKHCEAYKEAAFVNERGYESDTDYLVWVSKKDYTVNVYLGGKGNWRLIRSAKCAIGAPASPTIEGVFKYHQYQNRWQYDGYYCGPIMRFYRGYALHSTLIRNNGTIYDNRVGERISHGCVRLRPDDINYLVAYVSLGSTVVVTA